MKRDAAARAETRYLTLYSAHPDAREDRPDASHYKTETEGKFAKKK
jgi:hypothetical protein